LIWPTNSEKLDYELDMHLVFEYNEGDTILGYRAPRSNRFYFVTDPNGASFKQMESYHHYLDEHPEIKRHMFGGY
jgi:ADP-dependent phosphofructokinase/glucokinase